MKAPLSQSKEAVFDEVDFALISKHKWYYANGYARRHNGYRKAPVPMHREILGARKGQVVDHINGDKLDNRRENLRICTTAQNGQNSRVPVNNLSGYKGVTWHKYHKRWLAQIMKNGKQYWLGYFDDPADAARAYNKASEELHGAFARPNLNLCS